MSVPHGLLSSSHYGSPACAILRDLFRASMLTPHLRAGLSHAVPSASLRAGSSGLGSSDSGSRLLPKVFRSFAPPWEAGFIFADSAARLKPCPSRSKSRSRSKAAGRSARSPRSKHQNQDQRQRTGGNVVTVRDSRRPRNREVASLCSALAAAWFTIACFMHPSSLVRSS